MKKMVCAILAGIMMCGAIAGCSSSGVSQEEYDRLASELEEANSKLDELNSAPESSSFSSTYESAVSCSSSEPVYLFPTKVMQGETIEIPGPNFLRDPRDQLGSVSIEYAKIANVISPSNPDIFYNYYEASSGKTYVDVCFSYENYESNAVMADEVISAELVYDDEYHYTGFSILEYVDHSDFTYTNITSVDPLTREYIHYLFEVPSEVEYSEYSIEIIFSLKEGAKQYSFDVRK